MVWAGLCFTMEDLKTVNKGLEDEMVCAGEIGKYGGMKKEGEGGRET